MPGYLFNWNNELTDPCFRNPTPHLDETVNVTWPVVNATGGTDVHYLNIDTVLEARVNPDEKAMDFWDVLYDEYGNEPYNTY